MPELPEVETISRELENSGLIGLRIEKVNIYWDRTINAHSTESFLKTVQGQKITGVSRRGKLLVISLSHGYLLIHLRMTGKFSYIGPQGHLAHERVRLLLSDGRVLSFQDQRKFGRWTFVEDLAQGTAHIGVEPLSDAFTFEVLHELIQGKKTAVKPFLLNQKYISGLGNIYVDEALFEAKIHPLRQTSSLTRKELALLHQGIVKVLKKGIDYMGTSLGNSQVNYFSVSGRQGGNQYRLNVFRKEGEPCGRCGTIIEKIRVAQRGTHFCPNCQQLTTLS